MKRFLILSTLLILLFNSGYTQNQSKQISDEERMEWWTDARFGMFIHWGIYSVPAGFYKGKAQTNSAEWIMNKGKIPLHEYEKFADQFNPTQFDAKTFVGLAKQAGLAESEFAVELNGQTKSVKIPATGSYENFKPLEIGTFDINEPGNYKITFKPVIGKWQPVNLKDVVMTPKQ